MGLDFIKGVPHREAHAGFIQQFEVIEAISECDSFRLGAAQNFLKFLDGSAFVLAVIGDVDPGRFTCDKIQTVSKILQVLDCVKTALFAVEDGDLDDVFLDFIEVGHFFDNGVASADYFLFGLAAVVFAEAGAQ